MGDPTATAPGLHDGSKHPSPWIDRWDSVRQPWWFDPYFSPLIAWALPHLAPCLEAGGRLLQVGSGVGDKTDALRLLGADAVGLELSSELVGRARRTFPDTQFVEGDALAMPFPDRSFDALFSFSVMQCLDWRRLLEEVRRVLRPGGRVVFIENLAGSPFAQAYRWGKQRLRSPYRAHQTPLRHLAWEERHELQAAFTHAESRAFHLLSPALLAPALLAQRLRGRDQMSIPTGPWFTSTAWLDEQILHRLPGSAAHAWKLVVLATL